MSKRAPELLIQDIVDCAEKIVNYTMNLSFEEFNANGMIVDAVIRNFEVIGEAANKLPDELREKMSEIDWHRIRGFRYRVAHDYMGINYAIVWQIRNEFLPFLIEYLKTR